MFCPVCRTVSDCGHKLYPIRNIGGVRIVQRFLARRDRASIREKGKAAVVLVDDRKPVKEWESVPDFFTEVGSR